MLPLIQGPCSNFHCKASKVVCVGYSADVEFIRKEVAIQQTSGFIVPRYISAWSFRLKETLSTAIVSEYR